MKRATCQQLFANGPRPLAVGTITVTYDATASWTNPSGSTATGVGVLWKSDTCPTGPADELAFGRVELGATPGAATATQDQLPFSGPVCVFVQPFDRDGQPAPASTAILNFP